jgi:hypothetical protein
MDIRFQRILECSLHFLKKGMDFQEFGDKLWETMNPPHPLWGCCLKEGPPPGTKTPGNTGTSSTTRVV